MPNVSMTRHDAPIILAIVERAKAIYARAAQRCDALSLQMDIAATHNTCPLRLEEWLAAGDADFSHDLFGITRHMDRTTGHLTPGFKPRFAESARYHPLVPSQPARQTGEPAPPPQTAPASPVQPVKQARALSDLQTLARRVGPSQAVPVSRPTG
jgi:hypothetical protein